MGAIKIIDIENAELQRIQTGIKSFDEFVGGGLVPGSTFIFAGQPGVGKSTFVLQLSNALADGGTKVLYASGEESLTQVKQRADRLGALHPEIWCSEALNLEPLFETIESVNPDVIIIDSLQMLYSKDVKQPAGSPSQMRQCLHKLIGFAKKNNKVLLVIGHSTKAGLIAGLLTLQHMVDVVLFMELMDDGHRRMVGKKNRYGSTNVQWIVEMTSTGLQELDSDYSAPAKMRTIEVTYPEIVGVIESSGKISEFWNRFNLHTPILWLFGRLYGDEDLKNIQQYDIIYRLKEDK